MSADQVFEVLEAVRDRLVRFGTTSVKLSKRGIRYLKISTIGEKPNPGWREKELERWSTPELVDFFLTFKNEFHIGIKFITRLVGKSIVLFLYCLMLTT